MARATISVSTGSGSCCICLGVEDDRLKTEFWQGLAEAMREAADLVKF